MHALDKTFRNKLENTVTKAREVAEAASKITLEQIGVEQYSPYLYLTEEQREIRRKLRTHSRQLGDVLDPEEKTQEIERLIEEVAYEHWHRMLFARFLAENQLLMFYEDDDIDNAVAVTLEECEEMASDMGCTNGWELAAKIAAKMLPQIFRPDSPVYMIHFSPEKQRELEIILAELPSEIFTASDSLGWVYQFWQTKKKKEVNDAGNKIGSRELPAVTQLFTEPYMVRFLLDNSLGVWWAKRRLTKANLETVSTEEELRNIASLKGVPLEYLRFIKGKDGYWAPAGGDFEGWPEKLSELKALDPCCGSGHFLVSAFLMLVPMRMELEGLLAKEACDAVLEENIHGLEIDQRCVELAAFAVALTAWKYPGAGGFRVLPELQIAWCGQSVNIKKEEWLALAEDDSDLRIHLEDLYNLFEDAPILGSLLNPRRFFNEESIFAKDLEKVSKILQAKIKKKSDEGGLGIVAQGMERSFELLGDKYQWVITNVPYLKKSKQSFKLQEFSERNYKHSKNALETVFLQRCLEFCYINGNVSIVLPQNWLFLTSYKNFRKNLLENESWNLVGKLGSGAFETISGEVVKAILISIKHGKLLADNKVNGIDVSNSGSADKKAIMLKSDNFSQVRQNQQLCNPDCRIVFEDATQIGLLAKYASGLAGIQTGDFVRFGRYFWECKKTDEWAYEASTVNKINHYSGKQFIIYWQNFEGELAERQKSGESFIRGWQAFGKEGVLVSAMSKLPVTLYKGELFDNNCAVVIPKDHKLLPAIWCYCSSEEYCKEVRKIDQKLNVTNATLVKVPFDLDYWQKVAEERYPNGLPKPYTDDPTQWIFHGNPAYSESPLQVAVARLLGYKWPAEVDINMELSDEAREHIGECNDMLPYADMDGIVCIPPVRGEVSASERLLDLLAVAYKGQDINMKVSELLAACDHAGKNLESWLRDKFFTQHFKLFGHRPFIWHIWDGLSDGFAVLVNCNKLDRRKMETLIYTYLGDWINKQKAEIAAGVDGAQEKFAAAENLKKSLGLILQGEAPYDSFIRWKPIHMQPIGWEPDTNDGVRLNIRPFLSVPDIGKKGAGILRDKPNIKWGKDRGKEALLSPWYHKFAGDRVNDFHLKLGERKNAREDKG